jgi:hypothetical protein
MGSCNENEAITSFNRGFCGEDVSLLGMYVVPFCINQ